MEEIPNLKVDLPDVKTSSRNQDAVQNTLNALSGRLTVAGKESGQNLKLSNSFQPRVVVRPLTLSPGVREFGNEVITDSARKKGLARRMRTRRESQPPSAVGRLETERSSRSSEREVGI